MKDIVSDEVNKIGHRPSLQDIHINSCLCKACE